MEKFLRLFYEYGQGNISYGEPPAGSAPGVLNDANNGLSPDATGHIAQLGQDLGAVGDPAQLLSDREVPFAGFSLLMDQIGQAVGAHLKFKYDPAAAGLFEPYIDFLDSAGVVLSSLRIGTLGAIFFGQNSGPTCTGRQNFALGSNSMRNSTTARDSVAIGAQTLLNAVTSEKNVAIGADTLDTGAASIGNFNTAVGSLNMDNGKQVGSANVVLGAANNNSSGGMVGDRCIIVGNSCGIGDAVTAPTEVYFFGHDLNSLISNVLLLGNSLVNVIIGTAQFGFAVDDGHRLQVLGNFISTGFANAIRTTTVNDTFGANDYTLLVDTTAGNIVISVDPAARSKSVGNIKKISPDANTVTITPTSGTIQDLGAAAATLSFNGQGESVQFQSNGINLYTI